MKLRKFNDYLYEKLSDPEYAIIYVETALEEGSAEDFLYALRKVAIAQGGVQKAATVSQRGRESLYKSLSKQGNPRIKTLDDILHALGMQIAVARVQTAPPGQPEQSKVTAHA